MILKIARDRRLTDFFFKNINAIKVNRKYMQTELLSKRLDILHYSKYSGTKYS